VNKKKKFIIIVDIITLIVIILHIQSYILFIMKRFDLLYNYNLYKFILYHGSYGVFGYINSELERSYIVNIIFIVYQFVDYFIDINMIFSQ